MPLWGTLKEATRKSETTGPSLANTVEILQNLQNFAKFPEFQLDTLVDFEDCCKTRIFLQKSVPIQPKTSNILPKFCRSAVVSPTGAATRRAPTGHRAHPRGAPARAHGPLRRRRPRVGAPAFSQLKKHFANCLQNFSGLVLGCIKTKFCKKICV